MDNVFVFNKNNSQGLTLNAVQTGQHFDKAQALVQAGEAEVLPVGVLVSRLNIGPKQYECTAYLGDKTLADYYTMFAAEFFWLEISGSFKFDIFDVKVTQIATDSLVSREYIEAAIEDETLTTKLNSVWAIDYSDVIGGCLDSNISEHNIVED